MKKKVEIDNKGLTLVEILIVVAILAILGGVALTGMSLLTSRPVDECAKKIQIALEGSRNTTMGKYSGYVEFTADSDGVYVEKYINGTSDGRIKIGSGGVNVTATTNVNKIEVFSLDGKMVMSDNFVGNTRVKINVGDLADGIYVLKAHADGQTHMCRIIKK